MPAGDVEQPSARELLGLPGVLLVLSALLRSPLANLRPSNGTDQSWMLGINSYRQYGLHFGSELIYTYGPWGSIDYPLEVSRRAVLVASIVALAATAAAWLAFYALFRRLGGSWLAAGLTTVVVLIGLQAAEKSAILLAAGVAAAFSYLAWRAPGRLPWLPAGIAGVAAFLTQAKFSEGLVLTVIAAVCVVWGPDRRGRRAVEAAGAWLVVTALAWLAAGQALGDYPRWFAGALQVARGYSDAMSMEVGPTWRSYLIMTVLAIFIGVFAARRFRAADLGAAIGVAVVAALALYLGLKEATVRHGVDHDVYFYMLVLPVALGFLAVGPHRARYVRGALLASVVLLATSPWVLTLSPGTISHRYATTARVLIDRHYRSSDLAAAKARAQRSYGISPAMQRDITGPPLAVDTAESSIAWAYDLDWSPAPVFQTYVAYTAELDRRNADAIANSSPQQRILRSSGPAVDGRNALWDSPRYVVSELCNFRPIRTEARWMLLAKASDRCGPSTAIGGLIRVEAGQAVPVPAAGPDQVVLMSFAEAEPGLLVSLGRLLDKSFSPLTVKANGKSYRLPRALSGGPLIVRLPTSSSWIGRYLVGTPYSAVSFSEPGAVSFSILTLKQ